MAEKATVSVLLTAQLENGIYVAETLLGKVPLVSVMSAVVESRGIVNPLGIAHNPDVLVNTMIATVFIVVNADSPAALYFIPKKENDDGKDDVKAE